MLSSYIYTLNEDRRMDDNVVSSLGYNMQGVPEDPLMAE